MSIVGSAVPRVSVVMASYNHAPFVREAVESVLAQTFTDLELVITDDGSSDDTAEIIRGIVDPRIRFEALPENGGACVAMNDAIMRARGECIAVLNSDDYFLPGKLKRQVSFLDSRPDIGAVFGLPRFVDQRGVELGGRGHVFAQAFTAENRLRDAWLRHFFFHGNCLCHPTVMVRRACYEKAGLFDPLLMQLPDLDFWIRLCRDFDIHILPEALTAFRVLDREQNVSAPSRAKQARCAWEGASVLQHYSALPEAWIRAIFDPEGRQAGIDAKVILALAAIKSDRPGYRPFGCALLRDTIRAKPATFPPIEYFRLVGKCDPFQTEFSLKEYQLIRRSGLFSALRKMVYWLRARTS